MPSMHCAEADCASATHAGALPFLHWHVGCMDVMWRRGNESVDEAKLQLLGNMLWFADQAYEGESERTLHARLMKKGQHPFRKMQ